MNSLFFILMSATIQFCCMVSLIFQISCLDLSKESVNSRGIANRNVSQPTVTSTRMEDGKYYQKYEFAVFSRLLSAIYYNDNLFDKFGGYDWLAYKNKSIVPKEIDIISKNDLLTDEMIENLKNINQSAELLENGYSVNAPLQTISGDEELSSLFLSAKNTYPKIKAIVGLSKIGFSKDMNRGVLYFEYYSNLLGLKKFYVVCSLERVGFTNDSPNIVINELKIIPMQ